MELSEYSACELICWEYGPADRPVGSTEPLERLRGSTEPVDRPVEVWNLLMNLEEYATCV